MSSQEDHDVAAQLRAIPALAELPAEALVDLGPLVTLRRVARNAVVVEQGMVSTSWLVLARGAAKSVRTIEVGKGKASIVLDVMRAPCIVSDASLFDGLPASASVVTLRSTDLVSVEKRAFARVVLAHPFLARALLARISEDVRAHARRVDAVVAGSVDERVKHVLQTLATQHGTPLGQGRFIAIPLRRKDIASMVNATTETVSRLLARFEREGLARSTRDGIWWRSAAAKTAAPSSPPPMVRENA